MEKSKGKDRKREEEKQPKQHAQFIYIYIYIYIAKIKYCKRTRPKAMEKDGRKQPQHNDELLEILSVGEDTVGERKVLVLCRRFIYISEEGANKKPSFFQTNNKSNRHERVQLKEEKKRNNEQTDRQADRQVLIHFEYFIY